GRAANAYSSLKLAGGRHDSAGPREEGACCDGRYFAGVYLQSYRALLELGTRAQVACALRSYVHDNAYGIARPIDPLVPNPVGVASKWERAGPRQAETSRSR